MLALGLAERLYGIQKEFKENLSNALLKREALLRLVDPLCLGAYCVGCCWLFMVLGFAGGVMNFLWMGLATLMMVLEKLPQLGHFLVKPLGGILILSGLSVVAFTII